MNMLQKCAESAVKMGIAAAAITAKSPPLKGGFAIAAAAAEEPGVGKEVHP
jgi:hypothetical protein